MKFIDREHQIIGTQRKGHLMRGARRASKSIEGPGTIGYKVNRRVKS